MVQNRICHYLNEARQPHNQEEQNWDLCPIVDDENPHCFCSLVLKFPYSYCFFLYHVFTDFIHFEYDRIKAFLLKMILKQGFQHILLDNVISPLYHKTIFSKAILKHTRTDSKKCPVSSSMSKLCQPEENIQDGFSSILCP